MRRILLILILVFLAIDIYGQDTTSTSEKSQLTSPVSYRAEQIIMDPDNQTMHLRGNAKVSYENFTLISGIINIDWENNLVYAMPDTVLDSLGVKRIVDYPVFIESGRDTLWAKSIIYNIDIEEGILEEGKTKESNNFYRGKQIRKVSEKTLMIGDGYFTTCEKDTPDYFFGCRQLEMTMDDKIVGKDITFHIQDIPLAYFPFGVFPNKRGRMSGFLIPRYEYSESRGRTLRNIGYYWAINDNMDAEFSTDFFEKRGLLYRGEFRYSKRYEYNGYLRGEFTPVDLNTGDKRERWKFNYSHRQTISPNTQFSARGTFVSDRKYNSDLYARPENRLDQQLYNAISYSTRWPDSKNSLNINLQSQQNLNTGSYSYTLPDIRFTHSQRHLFGKPRGKKELWHNIYYSYSMNTRNQFNHNVIYDTDSTETIEDVEKRGMQHLITLNAPMKILKYINFTPSVNYTEIWQDKVWDQIYSEGQVLTIEKDEFAARRTFNASLGIRTTFYGVFPLKIGSMRSVRHKVDPSVSLAFQPDFSDEFWGYTATYEDSSGNVIKYDRFGNSIYGGTPTGQRASLNFGLTNLFQAKFIENGNELKKDLFKLNFNGSYNFSAIQYQLSDIRSTFFANPGKNFNLQASANLSPYKYADDGRGRKDEYLGYSGGILRMTNFNASTGFSITGKELSENLTTKADSLEEAEEEFLDAGDVIYNKAKENVIRELKAQSFSWQLRADFSYRYDAFDRNNIQDNFDIVPSVTLNLTQNWRIRWNASLDIFEKKINFQRFSIYRDLHCWELTFEWSPNTDYPESSYFFLKIGIKDPILKDLKLEQTSAGTPYF